MKTFDQKHLLGTEGLTKDEIMDIMNTAKKFKIAKHTGSQRR
ncbi:MAG: hypothetical protein NTY22_02165 [Proteobacteria bacterium]|nr:hypothetical protein [Pseudomonadota bacterium]